MDDIRSILPHKSDCFHSHQFFSLKQFQLTAGQMKAGEIVIVTDRLFISWILARSDKHVLLAGPVLAFPHDLSSMIKAFCYLGMEETLLQDFRRYQQKIPSFSEDTLTRFIKVLAKNISDNTTPDTHWIDLYRPEAGASDVDTGANPYAYDAYRVESDYMESIYMGDTQGAMDALQKIQSRFRNKVSGNQKAGGEDLYGHAVNCTLARIAAYQAGVSPTLLDEIFQKYMYLAIQEKNSEKIMKRAFRITAEACKQVKIVKAGSYNSRIQPIVCFILEHYAQNITLNSVAETFGMQKTYLSSLFRKETGLSFTEYVNNTRLDLAAKKILWNPWPIYEIAESVGITDYNYFSRLFRKRFGMSPTEYRASAKGRG